MLIPFLIINLKKIQFYTSMKECIKFVGLARLTSVLLFGLSIQAFSQQQARLFSPSSEPIPASIQKDLSRVQRLKIDQQEVKRIWKDEPSSFQISIPFPGGQTKNLIFNKRKIVSDNFSIKTSDGKTFSGKEFTGVHYQINSNLGEEKVGNLSFTNGELRGVISDSYGNWNIGLLPKGNGDYVVFSDRDLAVQSGFRCETPDDKEPIPGGKDPKEGGNDKTTGTCRTVKVYFECDFKMYQDNGSNVANTTNFVTGMFNCVKQLYENEQVDVEISQVFVWTSTDPYAAYTSANTYLLNFATNRTSFNGTIAHFLTTRSTSYGGLAYVNVLCNSAARYAFSNIYNSYSALPTYSWTVGCVAHEMGHNFGSKHTHWCGWQLTPTTIGKVDSCWTGETVSGAVNCSAPNKSNQNGTVMSYCHINGAINFNRGFGPLPGNAIRNGFSGASCVTGSPVPAFSLNGTRAVCAGNTINLNVVTSVTGATFSWTGPNGFTSASQNPVISSATSAAAGDYNCTVSKTGCTSDPKKVNILVNTPDAPPMAEGFESTFPASKWRIANPHNDRTWTAHTGNGGFGTSTKCIKMDNFNSPDPRGRRDSLFTPVMNLGGLTGASLTFDLAYAWNGAYYDTLKVLVSGNCGRTFSQVYKKTSTALATAPIATGAFTPTSTQWRKETIDLSAFDGNSVQVVFVNVAGWSNFLYLDNINISTTGASGAPSITLNSIAQSSFCPGATLSVGFNPIGTFNSGNSYSVQLSNSTGSFASPTTIGTGSGSPISCTIPGASATGSGYLIRVVASNPAVTSNTSTALNISPLSVSAGSNQTICSNGTSVTLTGTPSGGTWSGSGVTSGGVFTPNVSLVGTQVLTYSVSSGGCSGSSSVNVTVNAPPTVNAGSGQTVCSNTAAFSLTGFSPAGGTWSGPGVNGSGLFTPSISLVGNQTLTYSATSNGCTASGTRIMTVSAEFPINAGSNQTVCSNGSAISLSGTPAGGTWSGSGVNGSGVFTPSSALVGNRVLTYTVSGTCGGTSQVTVTVNAAPTVNAGIDQTFCSNDAPFTISQGSPSGGSWSGTGVSGNIFTPSSSNIGSHTLTYTVIQNGCTSTDQADFSVNPIPSPNAGTDQQACAGSGTVTLTGTPAGGTWSGTGVTSAGVFTPTAGNVGANVLTYNLTQNGCTGSGTMTFTVNAIPSVSAGPNQTANANVSSVSLTGTPSGGIWSGPSVTSGGVFSPSTAGIGTFTLTYSISQNGCNGSSTMVFTVDPAVVVYAGPNQNVCESASPFTLTGTPAGGTWSGIGVTSGGVFTPSPSLIGTNTLTYTVSGVGSSEVQISVLANPVVNAGSNQSVCSTSPNFSMTGASPTGGVWSGTGINSSGLVTTNQLSTSGSTFTYTVTQNGCSGSGTVLVTAVNPPVVNAGSNLNLCKNSIVVQLAGAPAGGTWSGPGVSASGSFDPAQVAVGNSTVTYTVAGTLPGCSGSSSVVISVFSLPSVNAGPDRSTCSNANPFSLSGNPSGGIWSGVGISTAGLFTPSSSLIGVQTLTYTVTQNGCSNTATTNVTVNALPVVSSGSSSAICTNSPTFSLSGASPAGGTWTGPSFVNSSGQCTAPFTAGTYSLTYSVSQNGCTASDQFTLTINSVPSVNAGTNRNLCANASNLTLTGYTPTGGVWTGPGVSPAGVFSPSGSLVGNQVLTYSVLQNGCVGSGQITVTVKSIPAIVTGPNESVCESGVSFKLNGYSPRGGKWTGPGVFQDSLYAPSSGLIGTHTLTYTVTKNGCTNSGQKTLSVSTGNVITTGTYPNQLCSNASPNLFAGFLPAGGTWKGPGMAANGLLTPTTSLIGSQVYTYRLDLNGCRDSINVNTIINAVPVVNAGPDLTICASGSPVALTNATPTGGTWSGQGVNDSGIFSPSSVQPGAYPLIYSFTQNGCTGTDSRMVTVQSSPNVSAGQDRVICKNSVPVTLTGTPFGGTWSGSGVSTGGVFTPNASMSGNITLTYAINENGCTGSSQIVISISNPVAINAGANQAVCNNVNPITLSGFSPAGGTWSGTGVSSSGVLNPTALPIGNLTLTYRVTQNGCTVQATKVVTVKEAPSVVAGIDQSVCQNEDPTQLTGFSPTGGTWTGVAVTSSGLFTPASANPGMQVLTYSVTANGCTASSQKVVTVVAAPVVDAGADISICSNSDPIAMSGYFPSGGTWAGNSITPAGVFNPAGMSGSFTFTYSITQNGCTGRDEKTINVLELPSAVTVLAPGNSSCQGQSIPLSLNIPTGGTYSIQWKRNNVNIIGAISNSYLANQNGTYSAVLSQSTCAVPTSDVILTFHAIPATPTISQNGLDLTSSSPNGNQWRKNGVDIVGATSQTFTVTQSGIYTVVVNNSGCLSDPSIGRPVTVTSVDDEIEEDEQFQISVFPNPNEGRFRIEMEGVKHPTIDVIIIDAVGKEIWNETLTTSDGLKVATDLHFPKLSSGVYWLKVPLKDQVIMRKMIIR